MKIIQEIFRKNPILAWLGLIHLALALILALYATINSEIILGINSMIKPLKFTISVWVYGWTMALLGYHLADQRKMRRYSRTAFICLFFEIIAITSQALRGQKSHFNISTFYNGIVFSLMGIFILIFTAYTLYIAILFIKQKTYTIKPTVVLGISIGIIYFVIFSFYGGYISSQTGHTVGGPDGSPGLPLLNWSYIFGDLRVAHFLGIHSLQLIPLFAWFFADKLDDKKGKLLVWIFSIAYFLFVFFTMIQALEGKPLMSMK
jgi:hypothetical protein